MTDDKLAELQTLFAKHEKELLQSPATIRHQMEVINGGNHLFRLFINNYTKTPIYYAHLYNDNGRQTDGIPPVQRTGLYRRPRLTFLKTWVYWIVKD